MVASQREGRDPIRYAETTICSEDGSTTHVPSRLTLAQLIEQVAVQAQREHGRDAVLFVLHQFRLHVDRSISVGTLGRTHYQPQVAVRIDEPGNDCLALNVNYARRLRIVHLSMLADGHDAIALDHEDGLHDGWAARAVNQRRAFEGYRRVASLLPGDAAAAGAQHDQE